jgi:hypothetical protein
LLTPVILRIGLSGFAGAGESAAGALAIQERSLVGKQGRESAPRSARP